MKNRPKMVEGRLGNFYAERCLLEQPHRQSGQVRQEDGRRSGRGRGMKIDRFVRWELPKE